MIDDPLDRLRTLCCRLPEVHERMSHGEPAWFVRDKRMFATYADHHHDDRLAFWCAAPAGMQESLVAAAPHRYFVPAYVGTRGWIGVYLDVTPADWGTVEDIIEDAYRTIAPRSLITRLAGA